MTHATSHRVPKIVVTKWPLLFPRLVEFAQWYRLRDGMG